MVKNKGEVKFCNQYYESGKILRHLWDVVTFDQSFPQEAKVERADLKLESSIQVFEGFWLDDPLGPPFNHCKSVQDEYRTALEMNTL